jgi:hypothetical protein
VTDPEIARWRLFVQQLSRQPFSDPTDVVRWMGAVQAQDYGASLLGVGLRTRDATEADIERALAERSIVRTHFMRNTVHLVPAEDLRWMMRLMAPRIRPIIDNIARANGVALDESLYARSNAVIAAELAGGRQLTRPELAIALERAGLRTDGGLALTLLTQRAQVDGLVCHGLRRGAKYGLVLVDDWLPPGRELDRELDREAALAEFARRYARSHGPATVHDFAWWSGLTVADARAGLESGRAELQTTVRDGRTYWYAEAPPGRYDGTRAHLLPNYDELLVGYKDRSAAFDHTHRSKVAAPTQNVLFSHTVAVNGEILGTWKRRRTKTGVIVDAALFREPRPREAAAVAGAAEWYGAFLGCPVQLTTSVV